MELKRHSVHGVMYNGEEICGGFAYYDADEVDAAIEELKARIAQLEDDNALLRKNNAELRSKNEGLLYALADAETDLAMATRWRNVSEELPEEYTDVLFVDSDGTYYLGDMMLIPTDGIKLAEQYWSGRGEPRCNNPKYWLPLPKAPEAK